LSDRIIEELGLTENKKQIRRILRETPMNPNNLKRVYDYLERFDKLYRTPEAHFAGGNMFHWTLSTDKLDASPFPEFLLDAWNLWNQADLLLGNIFSEANLAVLRAEHP